MLEAQNPFRHTHTLPWEGAEGVTPIFSAGFEPLARVTLQLHFKSLHRKN